MSNIRYLEIDSTYRDRKLWPNQGEFEVPIAQSGRKDRQYALNPTSKGVPITAWSSNLMDANSDPSVSISGTITSSTLGETSDTSTLIIETTGEFHNKEDYYKGLVLDNTDISARRRIAYYQYLSDTRARVTVSPAFPDTLSLGDNWTISDPTTISNPDSDPQIFVPAGRDGTNAYPGLFLYNETLARAGNPLTDLYRPISDYSNVTHILQLDTSPEAGGDVTGWLPSHEFSIRKELPFGIASAYTTTVGAGPTTTTVVITGGVQENYIYPGNFIRVIPSTYDNSIPAPAGEIRRIASYTGSPNDPPIVDFTATVSPPFSVAPSPGDRIEILRFTEDSFNPFDYTGSLTSQQELVCYEISLVNLVLPNLTLDVGRGSRIAFYPYVYVELSNVSTGCSINNIYSNNPNAKRALFRAAIDDVPNPVISSFISIDGNGMYQTAKFKPNDNLKFSVFLPNGEVYSTVIKDSQPPTEPNPEVQISALFSLKRL